MFTGIVEELGQVAALTDLGDSARIAVRGPAVVSDAKHGDSISVNGVCLTVVSVSDGAFTADVMKETLDRSSLGALDVGDPVNLERAALMSTRLGGHMVQGHVDGVGRIVNRKPAEDRDGSGRSTVTWEIVTISLPPELARYVVEKGSITVDGVSLTVTQVSDAEFSVSLIPTTLNLTTLGHKGIGAPVNLEVDVIAKYVEKLLGARAADPNRVRS
jgi:riboflavin synthase